MAMEPGIENGGSDEKARSESSDGVVLFPRRRAIFRPYCTSPNASTTSTLLLPPRDTFNASSDIPATIVAGHSSSSYIYTSGSTAIVSTTSGTSTIIGGTQSLSGSVTCSASQQCQTTVCSMNSETKDGNHTVGSVAGSITGGATNPAGVSKTPRRWEQWSSSEINAFFEGVKQFGKDFDQVAKLMARRKLNKDKDQIRNYYFNSLKLLRSTARIDDSLIADIARDIRELFIVINGFEWKRKVCGKFDPAKFRQLIMDGSTTVKIKKKKQVVVLRTPICPALQKYFPSCKSSTPLPSHVFICLMPRTEADRHFVEQCGQNPLVKIRIAIGDQISRIYSLLKIKWKTRLRNLGDDISKEEEKMKLVLYPDKTTRVGKLVVNLYEATPMIFSLNRLKKEQIQRTGPTEQDSSVTMKNIGAVAVSDHEISENIENNFEEQDGPFTINEHKLRSGLTEDNIHQATVTELYYLCGKETEIKLLYSTGITQINDPEPWRIFVTLLDRGYGDTLCKYLADPQRLAELDHFAKPVSDDKIKRKPTVASNTAVKTAESVTAPPEMMETAKTTGVAMVEAENSAFMQQLESLKVKKRVRSFHQRNPGKRVTKTTMHQVAGSNLMPQNLQTITVEANSSRRFVLPVTADAVVDSDNGIKGNSVENRSYNNRFVAIGKKVNLKGMNITEPNCSCSVGNGSSSLFMSPSKENTLPEDVRNSMEMMMQQNSVDYCRNFEELATTIETAPTAISSIIDGDGDTHLMGQHNVLPVKSDDGSDGIRDCCGRVMFSDGVGTLHEL